MKNRPLRFKGGVEIRIEIRLASRPRLGPQRRAGETGRGVVAMILILLTVLGVIPLRPN